MSSFHDKTYCSFYQECWHCTEGPEGCARALTPQVRLAADKWWHGINPDGSEPPICQFTSKPECFKDITK